MRRNARSPAFLGFLAIIGCLLATGAETRRTAWTTSQVTGNPDPSPPYELKRVFPKLTFENPVEMANVPGSDRLFVAELNGKIFSFDHRQAEIEKADLAFDLVKQIKGATQVYGLTFHPKFQENHFVYVCYILKSEVPDGTRVSRFQMKLGNPPQIDPSSEKILITWLSGGHNGGCLKFGPDGCLYISTGDAGAPNPPDPLNTGQDNSDLLSSILRIDVDHQDGDKPYRTPSDNPFVHLPGNRPEIWAYGFRNPWKMNFDARTGELWVGDVGWELWELVYLVQRGGNYGWSIMEGRQSIKPKSKPGPTPILPPIKDHPHSEGASITGGYVYYGSKIKELNGEYIYGDWVTGNVWGLRHAGTNLTWAGRLARSKLQVISFGVDNEGELYVLDYNGGIYELAANSAGSQNLKFPQTLRETGLFSSLPEQKLSPGVVPFSINAEQWIDGARAMRFIGLPGGSQVEVTNNSWTFPKDTVLGRTLSLPLGSGTEEYQPIETQILHYDGIVWNGYTYRWNNEHTDGALVNISGENKAFLVGSVDRGSEKRKQTWHFAGRGECMRCHNPWTGSALAFNALQLSSEKHGMIEALAQQGLFKQVSPPDGPLHLSNPHDKTVALEERARSYLHVNCAHCHRDGAGGSVPTQLVYDLKLDKMNAINMRPTQGAFGITDPSVIAAGRPNSSVLYYRMATLGPGRMPHIGSTIVDVGGLNLIHDWIETLGPQSRDKSDDVAPQHTKEIDQALESTSRTLALLHRINSRALNRDLLQYALTAGTGYSAGPVHDLFERFVPEEQRAQKLGTIIIPSEILALRGDARRGRTLFQQEGAAQCAQCHRLAGEGRDFGPDLSKVGQKYNREQLLDQIVNPSKVIDPNFVTYQVDTKDDLSYTGFIVRRSDAELVLKDANLQEIRFTPEQVKKVEAQKLSAMPEGLLQALTAQNAADLIEYLALLK